MTVIVISSEESLFYPIVTIVIDVAREFPPQLSFQEFRSTVGFEGLYNSAVAIARAIRDICVGVTHRLYRPTLVPSKICNEDLLKVTFSLPVAVRLRSYISLCC
jgi:hypothetical protein